MAESAGKSAGVAKAVLKLKASIDAGNSYEAQQMLKTVYHRFRMRDQLGDAYQLLEEGACMQLGRGQFNCGLELALLLAEDYSSDKLPVSEVAIQRLITILRAWPTGDEATEESEGATRFIGAALKWCRSCGDRGEDSALLHDSLAKYLWETLNIKGLAAVTAHFARGRDYYSFAAIIFEAAAQGSPEEEDLFLARALLQTLLIGPAGRSAAAAEARREMVLGCSDILNGYECMSRRLLPRTPLVNFLRLLLEALDKHSSLNLMRILRREYAPTLQRDPTFKTMLDRIEELWFGARQQGGMGGMLGNIMQMLAGSS